MSSYMTSDQMQQLEDAVWHRDGGCILAEHGRSCSLKHDAHHLIKQQRFPNLVPLDQLEAALCDPRGAVALCRLHHNAVHAGVVRVPVTVLVRIEFYLPGDTEPEESTFTRDYNLRAIWEGIVAKQLPTHRRLAV